MSSHLSSTSCTDGSRRSRYHLSARGVRASSLFLCSSSPISCRSPTRVFPTTHPAAMAKKSSSRKSLKGLFSKSEASLDGAAERDAEAEGEKKKFKLFRIKNKSKGGSGAEKATSEDQQVNR